MPFATFHNPLLKKWVMSHCFQMLTIFLQFFTFFSILRYYAARHKRRLKEEYADHHNEKLRPIDLIALRPKAFKYQVLSQIPSQAPYTEMDEYGLFKNVVSRCSTIIKGTWHYFRKFWKPNDVIHCEKGTRRHWDSIFWNLDLSNGMLL